MFIYLELSTIFDFGVDIFWQNYNIFPNGELLKCFLSFISMYYTEKSMVFPFRWEKTKTPPTFPLNPWVTMLFFDCAIFL